MHKQLHTRSMKCPASKRSGSEDHLLDVPSEPSRHVIPTQFKSVSLARRRCLSNSRVCSRVALYGTGSQGSVLRLMSALHSVLNCKFYGGFSRPGVWEAILTFDKNRGERPYEEEIERCLDYYYGDGSVAIDVLDSKVTRNVIVFLHRLKGLSSRFGRFPVHLTERVRQYEDELTEHEADIIVQDITGLEVTAENMMRLHQMLARTTELLVSYRERLLVAERVPHRGARRSVAAQDD